MSETPVEYEIPNRPPQRGVLWLAFTPDTSARDARAAFAKRYGREPKIVTDGVGLVFTGPCPEPGEENRNAV